MKTRISLLLLISSFLLLGGSFLAIMLNNPAEPLEANNIEALSDIEPEVGTCCPKETETCTIGTHTFTGYEYRKEGPCNLDN